MQAVNVLLTCGGSQLIVGHIEALKNQNEIPIRVIGTDMNKECFGKYFFDAFYFNSGANSPDYIFEIIDISKKEDISVIVPTSDSEALVLSKNKDVFDNENISLAVDKYDIINIVHDKFQLFELLNEKKIPIPQYCAINSLEDISHASKIFQYPDNNFVIKPRISTGARGVWIVSGSYDKVHYLTHTKGSDRFSITLDEMIRTLHQVPEKQFPKMIAMEYLPNERYNVDMLSDGNKLFYVIPRRRYFPFGSPTQGCILEENPDIIDLSKLIWESIRQSYLFTYEYAIDRNGKPGLFEINPRTDGTVTATLGCGVNLILENIKLALGLPVNLKSISYNVEMFRYWRELRLISGNIIN